MGLRFEASYPAANIGVMQLSQMLWRNRQMPIQGRMGVGNKPLADNPHTCKAWVVLDALRLEIGHTPAMLLNAKYLL